MKGSNIKNVESLVGEVLLEIDPVFLYNIPKKFNHDDFHRALEWNISAPDWHGKLLLNKTGAGGDCCQVQFRNTDGVLFGVAVITKSDFSSFRAFQKVRDSSRYCTQQIQNIVSGDSAVYGIGFLKSEHISELVHCMKKYFGRRSQNKSYSVRGNASNFTEHAQIKTEVTDGLTEDLKYTHHDKAQVDTEDEKVTTPMRTKHARQAPVKVKVELEDKAEHAPTDVELGEDTSHVQTNVKVGHEAAHTPIIVEVEKKTANSSTNVDVDEETAHAQIKIKVKDATAHVSTNVDVEKVAAHASTNVDVDEGTAHAQIKIEGQDATEHASTSVGVEEETAHASTNVGVKEVAAHASTNVGVKEVAAHASTNVGVEEVAAHASTNVGVKEETAHASTNLDVDEETAQAQIKIEVTDATACVLTNVGVEEAASHASTNVGVEEETAHAPTNVDVEEETAHAQIKIEVKDPTAHEPFKVEVNDKASHAPIKANAEVVKSISNVTQAQNRARDANSVINSNSNNIASMETTGWTWMALRNGDTNELTCPICPKPLIFPPGKKIKFLFHHLTAVHNLSELLTCRLCSLIFSTADHRKRHIKDVHKMCPMEFARDISLQNHFNLAHPLTDPTSRELVCPTCKITFGRPRILKRHLKQVHNLNSTPNVTTAVPAHPLTGLTSRELVCPTCMITLGRPRTLKRHLQQVHNLNSTPNVTAEIPPKKRKITVICAVCLEEFEEKEHLNNHVKRVHNLNSTPSGKDEVARKIANVGLACLACCIKFGTYIELHNHLKGGHNPNSTLSDS